MPSCIVKGCTHYTGMKASSPVLTMHVFPRELGRIKLWLQQIGQNFGDLDSFAAKVCEESRTGKYRICSAHFAPGSYTSHGSRIVLKHDAVPTLFPGTQPRPLLDWNAEKKPEPLETSAPSTQKKDPPPPQPKVDPQKKPAERRRPGRTPGPPKEPLVDVNGRNSGGIRKDLKNKAEDLSPVQGNEENRRALSSLENVLVSLLQHLAEAPLTSRTQKQKTTRLLNQTAEIVSVLTGEEWTVVKKNSHISKFYNMIREVPIKCGDVAVFFSMDEWDYIEDHEEHYKHVMVEEPPKSLDFNGSSEGMKSDLFLDAPCVQRHKFEDIDFGGPFDFLQSPGIDKEEVTREDLQVLEMSCSSDDDMEEEEPDPPLNIKIQSPSEDSEDDDLQSPVSSPGRTEKDSVKRIKEEEPEIVTITPSPSPSPEDVTPDPVPLAPDSPDLVTSAPTPDTPDPATPEAELDSPDPVSPDPTPPSPAPVSPERRAPSPAAPPTEEAPVSPSSELWIAQDGTTSSTWIPQNDPRPKGRNCFKYGKNAGRLQCPVSLCGTTTICLPELPLRPGLDHRCDLCDLSFPDKYELEMHQLTHSKRQRL